MLAQVGGMRNTWVNDPSVEQDRSFTDELLPTYRDRINRIRTPKHIAISRIGILFVAKQACIACDPAADVPEGTPSQIEEILVCCLIAHDLIIERELQPTGPTIDKVTTLLPLASYVPRNTFPLELARNLILLEQIAPTLRHRNDYRDLIADFTTATGVPPRQFIAIAYTACIPHIIEKRTPKRFAVTPISLANDTIAPAQITAFLQKTSITPRELCEHSRTDTTNAADFVGLQRKPLVHVAPDVYVAPDPGFLIDKAGRSLYWTLHEVTPPGERHSLLTYWSSLFEHYLHWLSTTTYQGTGTIHCSPRFANGDEAADLIITEGSRLLVVEAKASVLTAAAKYGFAPTTLQAELHRKAITGEHGKRKGVAQLHHNLTRWLDGEDIPTIDRSTIKTIYPALLFLDETFAGPYLHELYNEHFDRRALQRKPQRIITPLMALTITDLEHCLPYTHQHQLSDMLDSCYTYNRRRTPEHRQFHIPLLKNAIPGKDLVREQLNQFGNSLITRQEAQPPATS
jgi:hypothetical protein